MPKLAGPGAGNGVKEALGQGRIVIKWSQKLENIEVENRKKREQAEAQRREHARLTQIVGQCLIKTQVDHIFSSNHPKKGAQSRGQTLFDQILHDLKPQEMLKASKERLTRTL